MKVNIKQSRSFKYLTVVFTSKPSGETKTTVFIHETEVYESDLSQVEQNEVKMLEMEFFKHNQDFYIGF